MLKSKIHRATVTGANLHYVGSISIDTDLLDRADIRAYEQVSILNVTNGERFETYAMPGDAGEVCLNGAAARLVAVGDRVIVLTYAEFDSAELDTHEPIVVHVDTSNTAVALPPSSNERDYVEFSSAQGNARPDPDTERRP
jgi:aspartate 1-decarboxylase